MRNISISPIFLCAAISSVLFPAGVSAVVAPTQLAYVTIVPCRIVDTRIAGGPLGAKETRTFSLNGGAAQGGSGCTVYPGSVPFAVGLNVTVDAKITTKQRLAPARPKPAAAVSQQK